MGNHIGLRKVTRRTQPVFQGLIKAEVDIHLLVTRTVKRAHGSLARAAGGGRHTPKQHQFGFGVGRAALVNTSFQTSSVSASTVETNLAMRSSAGGLWLVCLLNICAVGASSPLSRLRMVSGLMPKIHPQQRNHDRADANTAPAPPDHPNRRPLHDGLPRCLIYDYLPISWLFSSSPAAWVNLRPC